MDKDDKNIGDKLSEKLSSLNAEEKLEDLYQYSKNNLGDTLSYAGLFIGVLLTLFGHSYGLPIVGALLGFYFSEDSIRFIEGIAGWIQRVGFVKAAVVGGAAACLLYAMPTFVLGGAGGVVLRRIITLLLAGNSRGSGRDGNSNR